MSGSNGIMRTDHRADICIALLWQYQNATRLKGLIESKQSWLDVNHRQFWEDWTIYIFGALSLDAETSRHLSDISDPDNPAYNPQSTDYPTAQLWIFGLSVWGKILNLSRKFYYAGQEQQLSALQYQTLLRGQFFKNSTVCTIPETNRYLEIVFGPYGRVFVVDNGNMSIYLNFAFSLSEKLYQAFTQLELLPRPSGVGMSLINYSDGMILYDEDFESEYQDIDDGTLSGEDNVGAVLAPYVEL